MARNPAIDPPRFAPPARVYSSTSPSPSTSPSSSPSRHGRNYSQSYDPLGRDLSPTRTLKAFTSAPGSDESRGQVALVRLIEKASTSERAFGIRIAQTCKDIKAWHNELQQWPWADSFEPPAHAADAVEGPYWGSLRENQVIAYEQRIQDIREALFDGDVDELKDYVLSHHIQPKTSEYEHYEHLDDFTALITATILRALPDLSRLDRLLNTWSMRVTLLRKVPGYLRGLDQAKADLDKAWSDMTTCLRDSRDITVTRNAFQSLQEQLESRMGKVGGRLDSLLDDLEGREETLPDAWIDTFESLETSYSDWLTQTERHIVAQNMPLHVPAVKKSTPADVTTREMSSSTTDSSDQEEPVPVHAAPELLSSSSPAPEPTLPNESVPTEATGRGRQDALVQQVESPILGTSPAFLPDLDESSDVESDSVSQDLKRIPTLPTEASQPVPSSTGSLHRAGSLKSLSPSLSRSRHVPIVVDYNGSRTASPPSSAPTPDLVSPSVSANNSSSPTVEQASPAVSNVRARAAFLNGGIERTQSLQKSVNSPVRSFEHASMAFTKLFNKTNNAANGTTNHSRTSSTSSKSSARKGLGLGIKTHEGFRHFHRSTSLTNQSQPDKDKRNLATESQQIVHVSSPPTRQSFSPDRNTGSRAVSQPAAQINFAREHERPMEAYLTPELDQDYFPSTENSKSTIDTAWNSPAPVEFPENWPLPLPVKIYDEEISTPREPMDSDVFEKMFVDSLPGTPQTKSRPPSQESNPFENMFRSKRSKSKEPLMDDTMLGGMAQHRPRSGSSSPGGPRPRHMSRPSTTSLTFEPITELPTPGSFDATPEVQDASAAGYFRAKQVQTSPGSRLSPAARSNTSWSNFSAIGAGHDDVNEGSDDREDQYSFAERRPMIKRASVTSIENHPRSELNTIEIPDMPRRHSLSPPTTAKLVKEQSFEQMNNEMLSHDDIGGEPPAFGLPPPTLSSDLEPRITGNTVGAIKPPPLNLEVHKRRYVVEPEATPRASESNRSISQPETTKKGHKRNISNAEQLDRHVSRVLNTLPSRIAFKPSLSIPSREPSREPSPAPATAAGPPRPRPALSSKPPRTGLTLSAVQSELTSRKSTANDADGKMYYLTQEGKEQPIKLFVRLVGEGERCMVRVGGGWADLGEYLRQYAEHHGHRTFSDGKLEVGSMRLGGGTKARTPLSRPGSVLDRPDSSMSFRSRSSFGAAGTPMPVDMMHSSPSATTQPIDLTPTTTRNGAYHTPTGSVKSSSRPSTADTFLNASPSSWSGQDIGLAGPSVKHSRGNRELDEQKARWVEEMMTRAKQASSVERKKSETAWSDMGKVGGTRRMVFRHKTSGENGSG